ncbi:hypothetical protein AS189_09600 [Arthrobacter alpinus]|uniref:Uncharacterized protein n=1 Tax=Arthrobacter alpinus TaxID=656366 RepID=A0A0S2LZC9_9MICC|nr:hypothetical protein AS189_09600 [Arthrobacter alpinus]
MVVLLQWKSFDLGIVWLEFAGLPWRALLHDLRGPLSRLQEDYWGCPAGLFIRNRTDRTNIGSTMLSATPHSQDHQRAPGTTEMLAKPNIIAASLQ